jgi:hypothetical protein
MTLVSPGIASSASVTERRKRSRCIRGALMSFEDRNYFRQRAAEERARAESASSPAVERVHLALAAKYDSLLEKADETRTLHVASNEGWRKHA